ncbi:MAG: dihydrodipicolinate synthase family protein [Anaerolineae bacterium]|nr:dihydrodipicolinate synthase family protein [Anaerolineae bacterium]
MTAVEDWRGIFAIPMTPFDGEDRIDEEALRAEIQFCIEAGARGLCVPVMVSEFQLLTEDERRLMIRIPVELCKPAGVPVVANCAALNTPLAVDYARYAESVGADAVIAMPPYMLKTDFDSIFAYFRAIAGAVRIPVWVQNANLAPLTTDQIIRLCSEIENVNWVKQEVTPSTHTIGGLMARQSSAIHGVMGGAGGLYLMTERARGACGVIVACEYTDVLQRIWDLLDAGEQNEAEELFDHVMPGIVLEGLMGMAYAKEIMIRRGVLKNNRIRNQTHTLDAEDLREIDRVYARIEPYFTWKAK